MEWFSPGGRLPDGVSYGGESAHSLLGCLDRSYVRPGRGAHSLVHRGRAAGTRDGLRTGC
ncbi:hypothetical protein GCM10010440_67500 [Kitasatospora cinereorecta]